MKKRALARTVRVWAVLSFFCAAFIPLIAHADDHAFSPGEKLEYELRWENVPAGSACLQILPVKTLNGEKAYHFVMTAESNGFIDIFYKVRDRIDSFADTSMTHSIHYQKNQHEGCHRKEEVINFDWQNNQAQYSNYGQKNDPIDLLDGSFDPLSAFYFTRTKDLRIGQELERPITDGRKNIIGRMRVVGRETITLLNGKAYDTYRLEPDLSHVGGVFKKSPNSKIQLWVTADDKRIPVRIQSKVSIGHFIGELVSADGT
jgi:Protein of unknown function (DUF3108)